jgi:hypothetical protein
MDKNTTFVAAAVAAASFGLGALAEDPVREAGDPPRWYIPADTPAQKYAVSMKEAGAALKEALDECRRGSADRKACEQEARDQWRHDVRIARGYLSGDTTPNGERK